METKMKKACGSITWWIGVVAIGIVFGVSLQFAGAWVNPPAAAPPGGNLGGPINTSSVTQSKVGALILSGNPSLRADNAVGVYGLLKAYANFVVEGTLKVNGGDGTPGSFQFKDGNQGEGKVLTSNNNGMARWDDAGGLATPPVCEGDDKALQWDGTQWICKTLDATTPPPAGGCPCACWTTRLSTVSCPGGGGHSYQVTEMCTPSGWVVTFADDPNNACSN